MSHQTIRGGPCGLKDGHGGEHRTPHGVEAANARNARYDASPKGKAVRARYDASPEGEDDTILGGGYASGLRPDRPYCDDCQMATQMATQQQAERPRTLRRYRFHGQRSVGMWGWNYVPTDVKKEDMA